jgi:phage virion morphogenesis protein
MSAEVIQIDTATVKVSLGRFRASLAQKGELMRVIGGYMVGSITRTFRDEGSPSGSWPQLAPSTIKSYGGRAAGHKLLVMKGRLLNSIISEPGENSVTIGPQGVEYAAVHQFGSRDRGGVAIGPVTKEVQDRTVNVRQHAFARLSAALGKGRLGNRTLNIRGPRNQIHGTVSAHTRHQNIPPRPYCVFRPEDPGRIQSMVNGYIRRARAQAGLEGA